MRPFFSSGPCVKHPDWSLDKLQRSYLNRSHRSDVGKLHLKSIIERQKKLLRIPDAYKLAIVPGSATGAMEMAMWCLLGIKPVDAHIMDVFSSVWADDMKNQLKLDCNFSKVEYGALPELQHNPDNDLVITLSATTTGVAYKNTDWIKDDRKGLVIVDATAAAFCFDISFHKFDAVAFSWQKGLGGEAAHGMLALSPRALQQLEHYRPSWPIPRVFSLWTGEKVNHGVFEGLTLNTPSMLALTDVESALDWAESLGTDGLYAKSAANVKFLYDWVINTKGLTPMADWENQAPGGAVCFYVDDFVSFEQYRELAKPLAASGKAFDIVNHANSKPSFRIWCGPTMELDDLKSFTEGLYKQFG
jgi:phosphoserine aminotransferase